MCDISFGIPFARRFFITVILLSLTRNGAGDVTPSWDLDLSIYYEPSTYDILEVKTGGGAKLPQYPFRYFTSGVKCDCVKLDCGCCARIDISQFNFDHVFCVNFTIVPEMLAFDLHLHHGDSKLLTRRISGSNPEPVCIPLPYIPLTSFCVRFYDIGLQDNKLRACVNFEIKMVAWTVMIVRLSCMTIGGDGISWIKPWTNSSGLPYQNDSDVVRYSDMDFYDSKYQPFVPLISIRVIPEEDSRGPY